MIIKIAIFLISCTLCLCIKPTLAEDFFEKDFAKDKSIFDNNQEGGNPKIENNSDNTKIVVNEEKSKVYQIKAIGAVLDSSATDFDELLIGLAKTLRDKNLVAGPIYLIGNPVDMHEYIKKLMSADPSLRLYNEVAYMIHIDLDPPDIYKTVSKHPTWILHADEGEIMLEGVKNLNEYLYAKDNKNIFVDKWPQIKTDIPVDVNNSK